MDKERREIYLQILACPKCKGDLESKELEIQNNSSIIEGFFCRKCKLFYPIVDDIPDMLPEEAINITNELS
ncbi:MAG: Trm112 family protein [Caldimicrobium sp.]